MGSPSRSGHLSRVAGSSLPIRSWSRQDRPRERLRSLGPRGLSNRELLAILIGSGTAGGSAMDVADRVLARGLGKLRPLATLPLGALESEPGMGPATTARIQAALELGRRAAVEPSTVETKIRGPGDVFARMGPLLRDLQQEEFHVLLLNTQHSVIRDLLITRGILDASLIHPREVFRRAIVEGAAGVILVHNHPSGDPTPSQEDRMVTRQLSSAGAAIGIPVLDHVIVGEGGFSSLAEEGLCPNIKG
ncbi:DNA repair protein RadC [Gemmatimonadota bacterium]